MIVGETLMAGFVGYSYWQPRVDDSARMMLEVIAGSTGATVSFEVETMNSEDTSTTAPGVVPTLPSWTGGSAVPAQVGGVYRGFKELWRHKITVTGVEVYDWVHVRFLDPQWYDRQALLP